MKEVSEIVKEYEEKQKSMDLKDFYVELLRRTYILIENDLCSFDEITDLNNYTKIKEFLLPIKNDEKLYNLYMNNESNKLYFIYKNILSKNNNKGIIINSDHLTEEDIEKVVTIIQKEESIHKKAITNNSILYFYLGIAMLIIGVIIFIGLLFNNNGELLIIIVPFIIIAILFFGISQLMNQVEILNNRISTLENIDK